ncbi:oxaloacetate decarboxylase subunit gamma [Aliivibrio salmonicida]|jgi:oxaloacetate decarboxylase gamma subunit|uniref:Probable oxaloacetate decarboxylase gamma chain n=1 Tax=Aliivibrio salmonicida (strain LFI1238) TaxID=316275 RepID=B6EGA8_ALISL|nr:oxaloacetate decarboxylase subunit gamma [Aliivibrio salmonicida]AZL84051.1 oxaloacetate decarboxylase subunit gamma [Aliivibrio salmonicida]CAQ78323.1 oxaloacetate decarboxylase 1, subunit gamma [Aliivibrio salmonicida LFI1238]
MTDIGSLLWEAATLMLTGMGVVFIFLTILVYLVQLMSKLLPVELPPKQVLAVQKVQNPDETTVQPQIIAAISAAVKLYRQKNR